MCLAKSFYLTGLQVNLNQAENSFSVSESYYAKSVYIFTTVFSKLCGCDSATLFCQFT